ncbi:hypothetical protein R3P38DRAFT_2543872 [Favolaschia claudopus]|uniref:DUF659 domain-containing protein n=1 Tax=Favolaschia claudopus TaxID=2862362 RepID=A0AAW0AQ55_9AGAR
MDLIGRERFAALASDNTGNTKLGRELAQAVVPTIIIVPDSCHNLSNTVKDITKIEYFVDCIGRMRVIITHFSHSSYSPTHLNAMRVVDAINKGLEAIGRTRFGTIYWAGYSVIRSLPAIVILVKTGGKFAWFTQLREYQGFELQLQQLVHILEPIARAIKCLEGLEVTVGDVYKLYVAITAVLRDFLEQNSLSLPKEVQEEVCSIINRRYDEMIHGPSGDLFLAGFFLDPGKCFVSLHAGSLLNSVQSMSKVPCCSECQRTNFRPRQLRHPVLRPLSSLTRIFGIPCQLTLKSGHFYFTFSRRNCSRVVMRLHSSAIRRWLTS